jgi:hypothetical protein
VPWSPGHPLSLLYGQLSCAVRCRRHQPRRATAPACSRRTGRATPRRAPSAGAGQPVWWRPRAEPLPPGWRWPFRTHGPAHAPRSSRPRRWALLTATQCHPGTRRPAPPLTVTLARMRWFAAARPPRRFRVDVPPLPTCRPSAHRRATARRLSVAHTIKNVVRHWVVTDGTDFPLILLEARDAHTSVQPSRHHRTPHSPSTSDHPPLHNHALLSNGSWPPSRTCHNGWPHRSALRSIRNHRRTAVHQCACSRPAAARTRSGGRPGSPASGAGAGTRTRNLLFTRCVPAVWSGLASHVLACQVGSRVRLVTRGSVWLQPVE